MGASTLSGETSDSFEIPGTESQEAFDLLSERFPDAPDQENSEARVVFAAPDGELLTDPQNKAAVDDVLGELANAPQVAGVASPFEAGTIAESGDIAFADVSYSVKWTDLTDEAKDALTDSAQQGRDAGLTVELSGEAVAEGVPEGGSELIGLLVAAVVLVITFGSLTAAGLPLLNAIVGVGIAISAITAATGFFDMGGDTSILAMMLGLAVAIDYALFIVSRYRHELAIGREGSEAAGRALGTAGSAVVFAGLTVMIALSGLWVVGIPMLTEMGLAAAFAVGVAVIIALSLLPAMLGFAKHRVLGGKIPFLKVRDPEADDDDQGKPSAGARWVGLITRHPKKVVAIAVVAMLALAAPVLDMRLGLPTEGAMSEDTTQRQAYDLVSEGFGEGYNGQLMVVVDAADSDNPQAAIDQTAGNIEGLDNVAAVVPPMPNSTGDTAIIGIIPERAPDSQETEDLVGAIRDMGGTLEGDTGASLAVTGNTAVELDFSDKMSSAMAPYLGIVVGLSFILLMLVFRSVLVPLKAAAGFLVTMGATFGLLVAIFQWGWFASLLGIDQTGPIISMLPIFLIGVVFGLAMDYEVFLVTRMREEYVHGAQPTQAVVTGFRHGSRVVTAAAIIMISVFGAFVFGGEDFIMQVGLAMAGAVAFDAFVVRMTIVPALLTLMGDRAWWLPRWLNAILPNVDVEGDKLAKYLDERDREREPAVVGS